MVHYLINKYKNKKIYYDEHLNSVKNELNKTYKKLFLEEYLNNVFCTNEIKVLNKNVKTNTMEIENEVPSENMNMVVQHSLSSDLELNSEFSNLSKIVNLDHSNNSSSMICDTTVYSDSEIELQSISNKSISFDLKLADIKNNDIKIKKFVHNRYSYEMKLNVNREVMKSPSKNEVFQKCTIEDAEFTLNNDEYENTKELNSSYSTNMRFYDVVREKYKYFNNVCGINFKSLNNNKKSYVFYWFCAFEDCCKYKFVLNKKNKRINVYRNKTNLCHPEDIMCKVQQRGIKRVVKQAELLYKPAIKHYNE